MTNEQAYSIILQVVNAHMCNKSDRIILDEALQKLLQVIEKTKIETASGSS